MTENNTNLPSQPTEPDKDDAQHVSGSSKKRGRFASDGTIPRRTATTASSARFNTSGDVPVEKMPVEKAPAEEQSAVVQGTTNVAGTAKRFEAGASVVKSAEPTQEPTQSNQSVSVANQSVNVAKQPVSVASALPVRLPIDAHFEKMRGFLLAAIMVPLCIWASWHAWERILYEWRHTEDYNHGWLIIPATLYFLYMRRETYPGTRYKLDWLGLFPILLYGILRFFAGLQYIEFLDDVAIWFWILSIVWFFYGWRAFLWAFPSLCFLVFMFQLPWRVDVFMKSYLQQFAAQFAAAMLTTIGETAIPIGNTIRLATMELGVEEACSGLRILMSMFAVAYAAVLLLQRSWWQNVLFIAIAAPLALFVNAVRITITGYLLVHYHEFVANWTTDGQSTAELADAWAGKVAIVLALGLFALFVWYLGKVFRRVEI